MGRLKTSRLVLLAVIFCVCLGALFLLLRFHAFGAGSEETVDYVKSSTLDPDTTDKAAMKTASASFDKTVTNGGLNTQDAVGLGVEPSIPGLIPTSSGKKGTETNPFVVLEIVPDYAEQQMSYLAYTENTSFYDVSTSMGEKYAKYKLEQEGVTFDEPSKIPAATMLGINLTNSLGKSFKDNGVSVNSLLSNNIGSWAGEYYFNAFKIGTDSDNPETEKATAFDITSLHTVKVSESKLNKNGYTMSAFQSAVQGVNNNDSQNNVNNSSGFGMAMTQMISSFKNVFAKDNDGNVLSESQCYDEKAMLNACVSPVYADGK